MKNDLETKVDIKRMILSMVVLLATVIIFALLYNKFISKDEIKNHELTKDEIKNHELTKDEIKNHELTKDEIKNHELTVEEQNE